MKKRKPRKGDTYYWSRRKRFFRYEKFADGGHILVDLQTEELRFLLDLKSVEFLSPEYEVTLVVKLYNDLLSMQPQIRRLQFTINRSLFRQWGNKNAPDVLRESFPLIEWDFAYMTIEAIAPRSLQKVTVSVKRPVCEKLVPTQAPKAEPAETSAGEA